MQRRRDRYANVQPDLYGWVDAVELPEGATFAVHDLVFEAWAMFDQAFGDRLEAVSFRELRALEEEPPELEAEQPALAAYIVGAARPPRGRGAVVQGRGAGRGRAGARDRGRRALALGAAAVLRLSRAGSFARGDGAFARY